MVTDLLFEYFTARSQFLRDELFLDQTKDLENPFKNGIDTFYGVKVNQYCFPLYDDNEPSKGFLNAFIHYFITNNILRT
jgi:hypothetical protein